MRLRYVQGSEEALIKSEYTVHDETEFAKKNGFGSERDSAEALELHFYVNDNSEKAKHCLDWDDIFKRKAPLHLEIGTGKGGFITECARTYQDINFIGMEKFSSVLVKALPAAEGIANLRLFWADAENLTKYFKPLSIEKIYLNFSDPWPKKRHAKRRLTSPVYLDMYKEILTDGGTIEFKTDNKDLFDYSLETASERGFEIKALTQNLHADAAMSIGNIMTEYERKFSAKGNPIFKVILAKTI